MLVVVFQMGGEWTVHRRGERDGCWCCRLSACSWSRQQENVTQLWPEKNSTLAAVIFCQRRSIFNTRDQDASTEAMRSFSSHTFYSQDLNHLSNHRLASVFSASHRYSGVYLYKEGKFHVLEINNLVLKPHRHGSMSHITVISGIC